MKLVSIVGENFGVLDRRPLDFSGGLQVIYGPNEAGKSTLLRLIRESLFGFPWSGHDLSWRAGHVAGTFKLRLSDGRALVVRRQKGHPDSISGHWEPSRQPVDETQLNSILQGASSEVFSNLFAFSLRELIAGEESLRQGGLGDSLFGGGWGGLDRYRRVQQSLAEDRERLFKPRGRSQLLLKLLGQIAHAQKEYNDSLIPAHELQQVQGELARRQAGCEQLSLDLGSRRQQLRELEQLKQAAPLALRQQALQTERTALELPENLTGDAVEQLRRWRDRLTELDEEAFRVQQQMREDHLEENQLSNRQQKLLALQASIRELEQDLSQQQQLEKLLPGWEQELREVDQRLQQRLAALGTNWNVQDLEGRTTGISQRDALSQLLRRSQQQREHAVALQARRPDLQQSLQLTQDRLVQLPQPRSITGLADLLERGDAWREQMRSLDQLRQKLTGVEAELERREDDLLRRLKATGAVVADNALNWAELAHPFSSTIEVHRERLLEMSSKVQEALRQLDRTEQERRELQRELAEFDRLHPQLDRDRLERVRQRRNAGWDLIRRKYVASEPVEREISEWLNGAEGDLAARFESLLSESDQIADHQLTQAEFLAKRDQLHARLERLNDQAADESRQVEQREQRLSQTRTEWHSIWQPTEIVPGDPAAMLEWLPLLDQFRVLSGEQCRLSEETLRLEAQTGRFQSELRRTFPDQADGVQALREARREYDSGVRTVEERQRLELELQSLQSRWAQLEQEELESTLQLGEFESSRRSLLRELELPESWSLETADKVLRELAEGQSDVRQQRYLSDRVQEGQDVRSRFADRVKHITQQLTAEDASEVAGSAVTLLQDLAQELTKSQQSELARVQRLAAATDAARKLVDIRQSIEQLRSQSGELLTQCGLTAEADMVTLLARFDQRRDLDEQVAETRIRLQQMGFTAEQLLVELGDESPLELEDQGHALQQEIRQLETSERQELERMGALRKQIADWTEGNQSVRLATHLESVRAEFAQSVDRWAPLALADAMLHRAMKRFEEEHQPRLLRHVGDWLSRLTQGRYQSLQQSSDEPGVIRVIDQQGKAKTPGQLSTGTREQLFLAIRLAYVADYAQKHEPLPLVLDDVLVNFDEDRAKETLSALQEFSQHCQILLLTCHRRTVELTRGLPESADVLTLAGSLKLDEPVIPPPVRETKQKGRTRIPATPAQPALFPLRGGETESET